MQIIFYLNKPNKGYPERVVHSYDKTKLLLDQGCRRIHTTQLAFFQTELFARGYRVYLYHHGVMTQYNLFEELPSGRVLTPQLDLLKLLKAGEFDHQPIVRKEKDLNK